MNLRCQKGIYYAVNYLNENLNLNWCGTQLITQPVDLPELHKVKHQKQTENVEGKEFLEIVSHTYSLFFFPFQAGA